MIYDEVLTHFTNVRHQGDDKAKASCPVPGHGKGNGDRNPSVSVDIGDDGDKTVIHCHAGCADKDVLAAAGLTERNLFFDEGPAPRAKARIVATYDYQNADASSRYEICRFDPKDFRPRHRGADGKWIWNLKGVDRIPYNLPKILGAQADSPIFIVEGEKDADALTALGLIATTNPGGCGSTKLWDTKPFQDPFIGRDVVVIPDADEPGEKHAAHVAKSLARVARSVKVVRL